MIAVYWRTSDNDCRLLKNIKIMVLFTLIQRIACFLMRKKIKKKLHQILEIQFKVERNPQVNDDFLNSDRELCSTSIFQLSGLFHLKQSWIIANSFMRRCPPSLCSTSLCHQVLMIYLSMSLMMEPDDAYGAGWLQESFLRPYQFSHHIVAHHIFSSVCLASKNEDDISGAATEWEWVWNLKII